MTTTPSSNGEHEPAVPSAGSTGARPADQVRFRFDHSGVEPGVHLLMCDSAWDLAAGYTAFLEHTGLDAADVYSGPVVVTPMPRYTTPVEPGRRRWEHVSPEAMWHPLFWLPEGISARLVDEEGYVEPEPVWAVRICLEAIAAGLYDQDQGWLDVLASHGLLLEDPDHSARILAWLAGQPDLLLDTISDQLFTPALSGYESAGTDSNGAGGSPGPVPEIDSAEPNHVGQNWAAEAAASLTENIQDRAFALIADELLDLMDSFPAGDPRAAAANTQTVLQLAQACLGDAAPDGQAVTEEWTELEVAVQHATDPTTLDADPNQSSVSEAAAAVIESLQRVRDYYQPNIDLLDQVVEAADEPTDRVDTFA